MKTFKRFSAILLAVLMMVAMMAAPASAATITVQNSVSGDYVVHKVFTVQDYATPDSTLYTPATTDWEDFVKTGAGSSLVTMQGGYVTGINNITSFVEAVITAGYGATTVNSPGGALALTLDDNAYYVIKSPGGVHFAFAVIDGKVANNRGLGVYYGDTTTIREKHALPTITKKVNGADEINADATTVLTYVVTLTAAAGTDTYTIADVAPEGVTLDAGNATVDISGVADNTFVAPTVSVSADGFSVTIDGDNRAKLTDYDVITITYTGKLNEKAAASNTNTVTLTYDTIKTHSAAAVANTDKLVINKEDNNGAPLSGAGFTLYSGVNPVKLTATGVANTYFYDTDGTSTEITTDSSGELTIIGLPAGEYTVKETTVPAGYIAAADKVATIVAGSDLEVTIVNTVGTVLPETGGIGTTIFYAVGGILVLGAVALLLTKKRMTEN